MMVSCPGVEVTTRNSPGHQSMKSRCARKLEMSLVFHFQKFEKGFLKFNRNPKNFTQHYQKLNVKLREKFLISQ